MRAILFNKLLRGDTSSLEKQLPMVLEVTMFIWSKQTR